jgi:hypothetical protein
VVAVVVVNIFLSFDYSYQCDDAYYLKNLDAWRRSFSNKLYSLY